MNDDKRLKDISVRGESSNFIIGMKISLISARISVSEMFLYKRVFLYFDAVVC